MVGVAESRLELHFDGGGERVALQFLHHVAQLDELGPRAGEGVVLGHVRRGLHLGKGFDVFEGLRGRFDGGAGEQIGDDFDPLLHAVQRVLQIHNHETEEAQHEQGERDRRHRQHGQQRRALEDEHRFAEREVHGPPPPPVAWSRDSSTAES